MAGNGMRIERMAAAILLGLGVTLAGCQSKAQTGGAMGAGIGAVMGQAIGSSTEATLIGAAVGGGVGYVLGNEADKKHAREMQEQQARDAQAQRARQDELERQQAETTATVPAPTHNETGQLAGTRWKVVSINPQDKVPPFASRIVEFRADGHVISTTTTPDGNVEMDDEVYRVVGNTLVINDPGYLINARFEIKGNQLILSAPDFSAVLERLG